MKNISNKFKVGDIYLCRFHPSIGSELKRYRPAVIVSSKVNQIDNRFILIAPFTTNTKKTNRHFELTISTPSLEKKSTLLTWYMRTIDVNRLEQKIGQLSKQEVVEMNKILKKLL